MKKHLYFLFLLFVTGSVCVPAALTAPVGRSNEAGDYLFSAHDLSKWSCGIEYINRVRDVSYNHRIYEFETRKTLGYVGYDIIHGITAYGLVGSTESQLAYHNPDSEMELGFGVHVSILDHEILSPTLIEDRLRIDATLQFSKSRVDRGPVTDAAEWQEVYGSLLLSIVNDIHGSKFYNLNSVAVYGGLLLSDVLSSGFNEEDKFGYAIGVDLFWSDRVGLEFGVESFGKWCMTAGLHIRL